MIDSIIAQLRDQVSGPLQEKAGVDKSNMDGIMNVVKKVAADQVGSHLMKGGVEKVMNLFSNKSNTAGADALQTSITTGIVSGLMERMNFSKDKASAITNIVVPVLLKLITRKNEETPSDDASPIKTMFGGKMGSLFGK